MKNIKSYESYFLNETMDMMTLPVNPIDGAKDVYGDLIRELGGKFSEFIDGGTEAIDSTVSELKGKASSALKNAESFFGKSADKITYDDVIDAMKEEKVLEGESFMDRFDRSDPYGGDDEELGTSLKDVKGGTFQKVGSFLQQVFAINILSFGMIGMFISSFFMTAPVNWVLSLVYSMTAWLVVHLLRKLDKTINP